MDRFGWSDRVEEAITLAFRRKGVREEYRFCGPVYVLDQDGRSLALVPRAELGQALDLTRVPVITIGGKRKRHHDRILDFLEKNPGFQGAFLTFPGSGNWDMGEGMIVVTSREILSGQRVSGGRPEVQLTNHRWLRNGRYIADRCRMLHGKVIETIEAELEQEPGLEKIAQAIIAGDVDHPLCEICRPILNELFELERRRVLLSGEEVRSVSALISDTLVAKFQAAGVRFVRDIPDDLTITVVEIAPELVAQAETLGTIEIPGLGRRLTQRLKRFMSETLVVELTAEEIRQVTAWPFPDISPVVREFGDTFSQADSVDRILREATEAERWQRLQEWLADQWVRHCRCDSYPKEVAVADPREAEPPVLAPVVWCVGLFDNAQHIAYPALVQGGARQANPSGWSIRWFDDPDEASRIDKEGRHKTASLVEGVRLERELVASAVPTAELPIPLPSAFAPFVTTLPEVMRRLGFKDGQFRIEGDGPTIVCVEPEESYFSELRGYSVVLRSAKYATRWWRKEGEVIVVFANTTISRLLYDSVIYYEPSVASQLGVTKEKIQDAQDWLAGECKKAEEAYHSSVHAFIERLQGFLAFASLSAEARQKVFGLPDGLDIPESDVKYLCQEWAKAETLAHWVESGEILTNWGGPVRRGSANSYDCWVVSPDGSLRDPDQGFKGWRLIGAAEIAISWRKMGSSADHECVVAHAPAAFTSEQLATVRRIEREIGAPEGAFGLDLVINRRNVAQLAAIREAAAQILRQVPEFDYYKSVSPNGVDLLHANLPTGYDDVEGMLSPTSCNGRAAFVIRSLPVASGVMEIVKYDKFGRDNYSLRWRALREEEVVVELESAPVDAKPLDRQGLGSAVDALRAKFGKK